MRQEQSSQKWVYLIFLGFGVLIWFLSGKLIEYGIYTLSLQRKVRSVFVYGHLVAAGLGLVSFWVMVNYGRLYRYIQEVVLETIKVSWPTKKEVVPTTIVVLIGVVIAGAVLGLMDHVFSIMMKWVLTS